MTRVLMRTVVCSLAVLATAAAQKPRVFTAPETFTVNGQAAGNAGAVAATFTVQIDSYTADRDRDAMSQALKSGGHEALMAALRKAPRAGTVSIAGKTSTIRWARQVRNGEFKRTITIVTDEPLVFVGGGQVDAKPRAGYDVAVMKFEIDDSGLGTSGMMSGAAKVKLDAAGAVEIDDYGPSPIKLITITRKIS